MKSREVESMILEQTSCGRFSLFRPNIYVGDGEIQSITPMQVKQDMVDYVPSRPYKRVKHDCDDQTFEELGHMTRKVRKARGFAWNTNHAFCVFLYDFELWVYDRGTVMPYRLAVDTNPDRYKIGASVRHPKDWFRKGLIRRDLVVI